MDYRVSFSLKTALADGSFIEAADLNGLSGKFLS